MMDSQSSPTEDAINRTIDKVLASSPTVLIALVMLVVVGFGSGVMQWRYYSGLHTNGSGFLTVVGLFALCLMAAKAVEWAVRAMVRSAKTSRY